MFRSHIQETCIKTSKKIGVLSRLEDMISAETKLHLYKYAILPYLTYCHIVWHFCAKSDRKKLKRIQERALRIVFRGKSATCEELLKKAGLATLYNQRLQVMMYKVKHKLLPSYVVNIFDENETSYQLRNENDFKIPRCQSKISGSIFVV